MKKILKILGLVVALAVILTLSLASTTLAASTSNGTQNQGAICNYDGCECVCDGTNCEPKLWGEPGPHGLHSRYFIRYWNPGSESRRNVFLRRMSSW